jgi:hypothetical protein
VVVCFVGIGGIVDKVTKIAYKFIQMSKLKAKGE